jgi:hypothetical protein
MPAYCSSCGAATFRGGATFCTKCGASMGQVPVSQQQTVPMRYPRPSAPAAPIHVIVRLPKSVGVALLLTILFGPFGLFYASVKGGLIMLATEVLAGILVFAFVAAAGNSHDPNVAGMALFGGLALHLLLAFVIQIVCVLWAVLAARSHNQEIHFSLSADDAAMGNDVRFERQR